MCGYVLRFKMYDNISEFGGNVEGIAIVWTAERCGIYKV